MSRLSNCTLKVYCVAFQIKKSLCVRIVCELILVLVQNLTKEILKLLSPLNNEVSVYKKGCWVLKNGLVFTVPIFPTIFFFGRLRLIWLPAWLRLESRLTKSENLLFVVQDLVESPRYPYCLLHSSSYSVWPSTLWLERMEQDMGAKSSIIMIRH